MVCSHFFITDMCKKKSPTWRRNVLEFYFWEENRK